MSEDKCEFAVGDRVVCLTKGDLEGEEGTVCVKGRISSGVAFDDFTRGHDCHGACKEGHGWFVLNYNLAKIDVRKPEIDPKTYLRVMGWEI